MTTRMMLAAVCALSTGLGCDLASTRNAQGASTGGDLRVEPPEARVPVAGQAPTPFAAVAGGTIVTAVDWTVEEVDGGTISASGVYQAPGAPGTFHVKAITRATPSVEARATVLVTQECWSLRPVDRVRFQPRAGQAAAMVGGTIQGSNDSPTNGFRILATISSAPAEGQLTELTFANTVPYRYVKYYGPAGGYGQIAEIEFYSGTTRLTGAGFGTDGSRSGNPWQNALDGNPATAFDGPVPDDDYVGIDAASGHVAEAPAISPAGGTFTAPPLVTLTSGTAGAVIRYTIDGADPSAGTLYTAPFGVPRGVTSLAAVASASCMLTSAPATAAFSVASTSASQSSLHIGNSLTDSINGYLQPVAVSGGVALDWSRYTVPGAGTYVYEMSPTGGFGVPNVQTAVRTTPYDHISMQPAANMPCLPTGHATESTANNRSDAINIEGVWNDAVGPNPGVQMWLYSTWPGPTAFATCMTGGGWLRDTAIWNPAAPATWEDGVAHMLQFNEQARAYLVAAHPNRPVPYIVPAGPALVRLKGVVEAGGMPGVGTNGFWTLTYQQGLGTDDHLTPEGRYLVTLVFYASMFQKNPAGLPHANTSLTDAQAAVLQQVAWDTVSAYSLSGLTR